MIILGLNAYHGDSSACLVRDGRLIAAVEEERFRRIKHWAGLPTQSIAYCLREAGVTLADVDHLAINRQPGVNNGRRLAFLLTHWPDPRLVLAKLRNIGKAKGVEHALRAAFPSQPLRATVHHVEHHLAHLASAFLVSPFEEAVCLSVDGFGDFASCAWGMGQGSDIRIDGRVYFPHSLGIFYSALTQFLGFPHFGDEYKVMGLAPYGEPKFLPQMREIVHVQGDGTFRLNLQCFRHHNENVSYTWNDCSPEVGTLYRREALEAILGPERKKGDPLEQRHKDLARSAQAMYEEAFFALLEKLHARYRCPNLALSGGCAMNSVANGKVYLRSPFRKMYLPASAGDAGGAIGAAFAVSAQLSTLTPQPSIGAPASGPALVGQDSFESPVPQPSTLNSQQISHRPVLLDAYSGPQFSDAEIESLLRARNLLVGRDSVEPAHRPLPTDSPSTLNPQPSIGAPASGPAPGGARLRLADLTAAGGASAASVISGLPTGEDALSVRLAPLEVRLDGVSPHPVASPPTDSLATDAPSLGSSSTLNPQPSIEAPASGPALVGRDSVEPSTPHPSPAAQSPDVLSVYHFPDERELCAATARAIIGGQVVGWFQGRMEWGPRALGNRSILGDPRRADMKDILNLKIKRRESFRPFAPSILREHVSEWFEQDDDVPFMMEVFQFRPDKRAQVPAVCHADGSGRLQTVHRETNPRYHALISAFEKLTGVPIILNTSFNENEPVVCRPEEALDCFLRTKMDVLVLGNWMVQRIGGPMPAPAPN